MNSDTDTAFKTFSLTNDVREIDAADEILVYDKAEAVRIDKEAPWKKDPHYFKKVHISVIALIKMVIHARSGGIYEIMGMMQGKVRASDRSLVVMDSFALPVQGTETRVNAANEANEYMVAFQQGSERAGRLENAIGWYHSHPGYGCWLSGIDVDTQSTNQKFQDPFVAVVIDPNRTISAGKVDIGAFRTFPADYKPPASEVAEYQSIPLSKIEDFGVHANSYYPLEVEVFKSKLDNELLGRLWNKYWVNTLSQSPLISATYAVSQLTDLGAKLAKAQGSLTQRGAAAGNAALAGIPEEVLGGRKGKAKSGEEDKGREESALNKVVKDSTKIAREAQHGLIAQVLKDIVFGTRPGEETQTGGIEARVAGVVGGAILAMDADMQIASYPQLQLIQRQHLQRMQQQASQAPRSLLLSPTDMNPWRASIGAPAHGTVGTFADLSASAALPNPAALAQRVGGRTDPLFNPRTRRMSTLMVFPRSSPLRSSTTCAPSLAPLPACALLIASTLLSLRLRTLNRLVVALSPFASTAIFTLVCQGMFASTSRGLYSSTRQTQKIPQSSTDSQLSDAFEKRMEPIASRSAPMAPSVPAEADDLAWRARVVSAPVVLQGPNPRPKFSNGRSSLETVLEDPAVPQETPADVFVEGLPVNIQRSELDVLFAPHRILDNRVCQMAGAPGMPNSMAGVMRLPSLSAARDVEARLNGWRLTGWSYDLKVVVIVNQNDEDNDNPFEVQPGRAPAPAGRWPSIGLGVPPIRSAPQEIAGRRISSMPTGSSAGIGTMASIHAPRLEQGVPARKSSAIQGASPIYTTGIGAVGSERSSPIGSDRHAQPLQLDAAFSPRSPTGSGSDGSMSPVSPALTFTSSGRTPTMAAIATPRHDDESKNVRGEGAKETGLDLKLDVEEGEEGEVTARAVGLAGWTSRLVPWWPNFL
ncbi:Mov34 protein [Rhizoctonia solani]|uniref:COP9 signalosome complex subunit 5 n=1 Tax=Rhizoctonia solani TaxID=456999 RepID=A0A8H7IHJ5_9AGAM|nr:Mov34 protein [Rhizoctonia solani]